MRLSAIGEYTGDVVPAGSFVTAAINVSGSFELKKVSLDKLGATGPQGPAGADGATILNGVGAPSDAQGIDGDYYINTAAGSLYQKVAGSWVLTGTFAGPAGPTGPAGPAGANGANGANGTNGTTPVTGGADTNVQFNDATAWGGATSLTYDKNTGETSAKNIKLGLHTYTHANPWSVALDFLEEGLQKIDLGSNVVFSTSNRAAGRAISIKVLADGSPRNLTFPGTWVWLMAVPATIAASKTAVLSLTCFGANDSDVVAVWAVQP